MQMKNIKNLIGFLALIALFLIVPKSVSAQVYGCDSCGGSQNTYDYSYIAPTIYTNTSTVQTQQPYQQQQTQTAGNYYGNQYGYENGYQGQQQHDYSYTAPTIYTPNTPRPEPYQPYTVILPTQYVSSGPSYAQPQIISASNPNPTTTNTTSFSNPFLSSTTFGSGSSRNDQVSQDVLRDVETKGLGLGTNSAGLCINDTVEYVIIYKNITKSTITNAAIKVTLADGVKFKNASSGTYAESDNSVTTFIGTLSVGQEGRIYITGVNTTVTSTQKVTRAEFVYTLPDQTQNNVVSYVFHGEGACRESPLAGFAAGAGGFFPTTLAGWIVLTLLICAIIYLTRYFMKKDDTHDAHAVAH